MMCTKSTTIQIDEEFKLLVKNEAGLDAIDDMLSKYPSIPDYLAPYLKAVYCKDMDDKSIASEYMSKAIGKYDATNTLYKEFAREMWAQAGEIYANDGKDADSVNAYKHYFLDRCKVMEDDISGGLLSFRPINKYSLCDLINNELTVSRPKVMNDPFDSLLLSWGEYYKGYPEGRKYVEQMVKAMEYYRIRSFSRIDSTTISNVLMWSHYADNHKGMCIKYEFSPSFTQQTDFQVLRFRNVNYYPKTEKMSLKTDVIYTDLALLTKQDSWKYEKEVRLITYIVDHEGDYVPLKLDSESKIQSIYFGIRCPQKDIDTVRSILANQGILFFQMTPNYDDIFNPTPKAL